MKKLITILLAALLTVSAAACGAAKAPAKEVDLSDFYETVSSEEDFPAMIEAEGEMKSALYPGLENIPAKQSLVYTPMISAVAGEIALIEVENAADMSAVRKIFNDRIAYQVGDGDNPGGAWYPETIEGWKNNARIAENGNYIMLVVGESADKIVNSFNELFK